MERMVLSEHLVQTIPDAGLPTSPNWATDRADLATLQQVNLEQGP
jgi:hypothetical protein